MPMATHPTLLSAWVSYNQGIVWDVIGDHGAGGDEGVAANCDTAENGGIGPNSSAASDQRLLVETSPAHLRARVGNISEHTRWSQEHVIFDDETRVDRDVILDFHIIADNRASIDVYVLAKDAALSDLGPLHDMGKMPNLGFFADDRPVIHRRAGMNIVVNRAGCCKR